MNLMVFIGRISKRRMDFEKPVRFLVAFFPIHGQRCRNFEIHPFYLYLCVNGQAKKAKLGAYQIFDSNIWKSNIETVSMITAKFMRYMTVS
jgi:hypothetical protein